MTELKCIALVCWKLPGLFLTPVMKSILRFVTTFSKEISCFCWNVGCIGDRWSFCCVWLGDLYFCSQAPVVNVFLKMNQLCKGMIKTNVLHTGLPKAGSTYFQYLLKQNESIVYYHHESVKWSDEEWLEEKGRWTEDCSVVISHEGLACSERAVFLYELLEAPTVLVLTRNIADWICSFYKHQIGKGEFRVFNEWLKDGAVRLSYSVDYERIAAFWMNRFGIAPAFIPMELLSVDSVGYVEAVNQVVGCELLSFGGSGRVLNQAIGVGNLEVVRRFNDVVRQMVLNHNSHNGEIIRNLEGLSVRFPGLMAFFVGEDGCLSKSSVNDFIGIVTKVLIQSVPANQILLEQLFREVDEIKIDRFVVYRILGEVVRRGYSYLSQFDHYRKVLERYQLE